MEALWLSDTHGWERFACYQPQYSLVVRDIDEEIVPALQLKRPRLRAWSAAGQRLSHWQVHAGQPEGAGQPLGRGLGFRAASSPPTMPRSCRRCSIRQGDRQVAAQVALRWVMTAVHNLGDRRRPQRRAAGER